MELVPTKQISNSLNLDLEFDSKERVINFKNKDFMIFLKQYPVEFSWEADIATFNTWSICLIFYSEYKKDFTTNILYLWNNKCENPRKKTNVANQLANLYCRLITGIAVINKQKLDPEQWVQFEEIPDKLLFISDL